MARVSSYLPTDRQSDYALLAFPEKLWWIVNNPKREEIHWNAQGTGIAIPSIQRFVSEILNNPSSALFKTKHFASFVRQLNLYGFRKVTEYAKRTSTSPLSYFSKCEFKHPYFRKGRRDLLVHVKRQLYSTKKPEHRRQKNRTPRATERQFDQLSGSTSLSATWNPALYTPMPFVPWQTSLQVPFTLYAPFCNPYQLAQTQQGPVGGFLSVQGLGLAGQFTQSPTSPSIMWTQSSVSCEGSVKSVSTSASMQHETNNAEIVSSKETLPVEADESLNYLHSPPTMIPTATVASVSTPNIVVINNGSNPTATSVPESNARHNGLIPGHSSGAPDTKFTLSGPKNNNNLESSEEKTPALRRESAESSVAYSQSFTVHAMLKESTAKPFASSSQSFTVDALLRESTKKPSVPGAQFDREVRYANGLCNNQGVSFSCVQFQKESANAAKIL